jgi:hypothetical protein
MFDITEPVVSLLGIPQQFDGAADLSSESNLTSAATLVAFTQADLSAQSALTADGVRVTFAAASVSFQFNLTVDAKVVFAAASIILATSNLTAESTRLQFATAMPMSSASNMVATMLIVAPVAARPMAGSSSLSATVYVPSNYLVLPTVEYAYTDNVLLRRFPIDNGLSLLINGTSGTLADFFAQEQIADADYYFGGGRQHILDDNELAAVEAAGYGEYIVTQ